MPYYAHSGTPNDKADWQLLCDHSLAVAALAAQLAKPFGLEKAAYISGLFHDLGKYNPAFQRRLEGATMSVDHSTAGAAVLMALAKGHDRTIAELCAYTILGHHAGLPDRLNDTAACFTRRVDEFKDVLDPVWKTELSHDLTGLVPGRIMQAIQTAGPHAKFDVSVVVRFIFSCLVDADFKDTETFYVARENREADREWPSLESLLPGFVSSFDAALAAKPKTGELNALRSRILSHVRRNATKAPGLFTLTVPTGGGKTLASLGFALDHAKAHGHRRIIFAIPFTSIVEQTAAIFGQILGRENILEHHSAIDQANDRPARDPDRKSPDTRDRMKLAMEDWAAPVVVTTNVQLFESLFAARTSRARKLHNIAGSIIILDEAQTIPRHLLKPCIRMLDSLARLFSCTIVLCTATQPALERTEDFKDGLSLPVRELAPEPQKLYERLKRTEIRFAGDLSNADLVAALSDEPQALVIVNSRKHAFELYNEAKAANLEGLVHLTTRQYAAHRRAILDDVRRRLKDGRPCRVIATSLIEAGVDVDFPKAWRA
jgi:CRISPR-associated endonuclease/helicase Cas3